ncbi:MAG: SDR family NAD(P)-dependent oxidoreductase, partial [Gemmobacter sp.]
MSTVMITGAGSGIGRALAAEADRHEHDLILVGRRAEPLKDTAARLSRPARVIEPDITTAEGRARIRAEPDQLDILI